MFKQSIVALVVAASIAVPVTAVANQATFEECMQQGQSQVNSDAAAQAVHGFCRLQRDLDPDSTYRSNTRDDYVVGPLGNLSERSAAAYGDCLGNYILNTRSDVAATLIQASCYREAVTE